jgi:hypothetical protein
VLNLLLPLEQAEVLDEDADDAHVVAVEERLPSEHGSVTKA